MSTIDQNNNPQNEIRQLLARHAEAISSKNADAVMGCSLAGSITYSLAPPLIWEPQDDDGLAAWFETWRGPIGLEFKDLNIAAGEEVGFAHRLGTKMNGEHVDLWFRQTFGLRKVNGSWRIAHEHGSVPFYMDGSFKAAVDLKPQ